MNFFNKKVIYYFIIVICLRIEWTWSRSWKEKKQHHQYQINSTISTSTSTSTLTSYNKDNKRSHTNYNHNSELSSNDQNKINNKSNNDKEDEDENLIEFGESSIEIRIPIKYLPENEKIKLKKEMADRVEISNIIDSTQFSSAYNQLEENAKKIYDEIYRKSILNPPEFIVEIEFSSEKESDDFGSDLRLWSEAAFSSLVVERPELWWIGAMYYSYRWYKLSNESTYTYSVTYNTNPENSKFGDYTSSDIVNLNQKIENIKNDIMKKITASGLTTNYGRLKYIHDYLVTRIVYNLDESLRHIRNIYGALVEDVCVCEGYAEAFQYIAKQYGIECIAARSAEHEWNFVKMNDNKWYVVDVTWDDPQMASVSDYFGYSGNLRYTYFLIGSESIIDDNKMYNQEENHILVFSAYSYNEDNEKKYYDLLSYPTLSTSSYVPSTDETADAEKINQSSFTTPITISK